MVKLIDLSKCVNLKEFRMGYVKVPSVNFPKNTVLNIIDVNNSSIKKYRY